MEKYSRVQVNINLDAICANIDNTREWLNKSTKIMVVIKADGYGHGAVPIAKALGDRADMYGVAVLEEGISLRKEGVRQPILILGALFSDQYSDCLEYDIMPTVFSYESAEKLSKMAVEKEKTAVIHVKLDTGMSRIGFLPDKASLEEIKKIKALPNIRIQGLFTHFACADEMDKTSAKKQMETFLTFVSWLEEEDIHIPVKHAANSASIIDLPEYQMDMVRSGISTYGMYPSNEVNKKALFLLPALEWKTVVSHVKELEEGVGISYGSTYVTTKPTKIATIPVGYADGYKRSLSGIGRVLIRGCSAPIVGRICMDQFMVDVTDIPGVSIEDTVTLIGKDGDQMIPVEEPADLSGSFNYEFVCSISKRVPRVFFKSGKVADAIDFNN